MKRSNVPLQNFENSDNPMFWGEGLLHGAQFDILATNLIGEGERVRWRGIKIGSMCLWERGMKRERDRVREAIREGERERYEGIERETEGGSKRGLKRDIFNKVHNDNERQQLFSSSTSLPLALS